MGYYQSLGASKNMQGRVPTITRRRGGPDEEAACQISGPAEDSLKPVKQWSGTRSKGEVLVSEAAIWSGRPT